MIIKQKPVTPGRRGMVIVKNQFFPFTKVKSLFRILKKKSGRNNQGKITCFHKGGRHKRKYRLVDFNRKKFYVKSRIVGIEYDPNRNSNISLVLFKDGEYRYFIHIKDIKIGDIVLSGFNVQIKNGNNLCLFNIPIGIKICCIELNPNKGAKICRSAGTYAKIISKDLKYCIIKTKSGNLKRININCYATIGEISNGDYYLRKIGKAGVNRNRGIRPTVRGVAMNPIDHPHGGGEGKTSTKRHPVNFKGKLTKGYKTVKKNVKNI